MMHYSIEARNQIFVRGYGFWLLLKIKLINHAKQSATNALKTASKRAIQELTKATVDLIENKITDNIIGLSRTSPQNSSETVERETENNEVDREITEKYINISRKKDSKLLMIYDLYNNRIMEHP